MRLLLISPLPPPPGGIATWTRILLRELERTAEVEAVHLDTAVRWRDVTNLSPAARIMGGSLQALRDYRRFCALITQQTPHVVHLCTSAGYSAYKDRLILARCRARGIPSIVHYRFGRIPALSRTGGWEWRVIRQCTALATVSLALDRASQQSLHQVCPHADIRTMPNMVDLAAVDAVLTAGVGEASAASPTSRLRVSYAGHVLPAKGITDLVTACARIPPGVELDLIGPVEPPYRTLLEHIPAATGMLRFRGTLSHEETLATIARSDVFALPSHSEGFPNVVAEAMACRRPVLGTRVGAMPDMLQCDGEAPCGMCVEPGKPDALAAALTWLAENPEERRLMGARGRQKVEAEYAAPVVTWRLVSLWRELAQAT